MQLGMTLVELFICFTRLSLKKLNKNCLVSAMSKCFYIFTFSLFFHDMFLIRLQTCAASTYIILRAIKYNEAEARKSSLYIYKKSTIAGAKYCFSIRLAIWIAPFQVRLVLILRP